VNKLGVGEGGGTKLEEGERRLRGKKKIRVKSGYLWFH
jgi:hypothetical protein